MSKFDFSKLMEMAAGKQDILGPAMEEYEDKFGPDSLGRCSTWDFPGTDEELAQLYRDCVAAGVEMEEYLGLAGDTGNDDL